MTDGKISHYELNGGRYSPSLYCSK